MLLLISEASIIVVCVTLIDVTDATTTTAPVMATSVLWALISSLARLRFLLSSMVPIVTGEIPAVGATRLTGVP